MKYVLVLGALLAFPIIVAGCSQSNATLSPVATIQKPQTNLPAKEVPGPTEKQSDSKGFSYTPPTSEEMAPMRPEYLAELAKIHEPPEMAGKPMQVRKAVSPSWLKLEKVMSAAGAEKATHEQRAIAIRELLEIANSRELEVDRVFTYGALAEMACVDGADPQTVIGYANNSIGGGDDDHVLALRARMYLKEYERDHDLAKALLARVNALDDLEKVMADGHGHALGGGEIEPRRESAPCGWSIADIDALGDDPRALAAKGLYLSSFIGYGAERRGTVKESDIRDLYARSARSWHSPIPHVLETTVDEGIGSERRIAGRRCNLAGIVPDAVNACAKYDEGTRQKIRELTMALVIDPTFEPARAERAEKYLQLGQASYADGKPSRQLFELAIADFSAALAAGGRDKHMLYCDRALALASIGRYQDAIAGYVEGMKYAKSGTEDDPFVYKQLAGVYMKIREFDKAADLVTQALINTSGSGMDVVIILGGMRAFRALYPEYDLLPDEILAEAVRRRYYPQFPQSWDTDFISKDGDGKISGTVLAELYVMRGDAYMKVGRRAEALADYRRVKSGVWFGQAPYSERDIYFNERGDRNYDMPEAWPGPPPML